VELPDDITNLEAWIIAMIRAAGPRGSRRPLPLPNPSPPNGSTSWTWLRPCGVC